MAAHRRSGSTPDPLLEPDLPWQRLVDSGSQRRSDVCRRRPPTVRRVVLRFLVANAAAVGLLVVGSLWASYEVARNEALGEARTATALLASMWIEPNLTDRVVEDEAEARARLDGLVEKLRDASATRIKIWDADGRIVYSDEPRLIGRRFALQQDDLEILRDGGVAAELSDLTSPENVYERPQGNLVEVYQRVTTVSGHSLLLELYFPYDQITHKELTTWLSIAPISAAALLLLLLIDLPLAWRMARQIRRVDQERLILHARAADASRDERRRIAGALHDGVVQDLSAAAMLMATRLERLQTEPPDRRDGGGTAEDLALANGTVRQAISSLRTLLIEIYPPHQARADLSVTLADLVARLEAHGVQTSVEVATGPDLPPETAGLVFRVAQEAVRNITRHAHATTAAIRVRQEARTITMEIHDDGVGFDPAAAASAGHFGMHVLADITADAGGTLDLASAPGRGTHVRLQVPIRRRNTDPVGRRPDLVGSGGRR